MSHLSDLVSEVSELAFKVVPILGQNPNLVDQLRKGDEGDGGEGLLVKILGRLLGDGIDRIITDVIEDLLVKVPLEKGQVVSPIFT